MAEPDLKVSSRQLMNEIPAPALSYLPPKPESKQHRIGIIGCGGISTYHLDAYRRADFETVAFCDIDEAQAEKRRDEYNMTGSVYTDYRELLAQDDITVVDIATHAEIRGTMIEAALRAGKHVLSQKPFVLDLDEGQGLVELATAERRILAVNQNGRWAPHFSYMRHAIDAGLIGDVQAVHLAVHWDHTWTADTVFNEIPHLILYDFAIHWFDILSCFMGDAKPLRVYASEARTTHQRNAPPMLGQVLVEYEHAQATLVFDAATSFGAADESRVIGTNGTLESSGPDLSHQEVRLYTPDGIAASELSGEWFTNGFEGTMAELLCAIETGQTPYNNAQNNLDSLALCFAAIRSAETHEAQVPGTIRRLPG